MSHQILFYKKSCVYCKKLFELLQKSPKLMSAFLIICVDDKRYHIPKQIKSVPSAIITSPTGEPQLFTGTNLFNWVKSRIHSQERAHQPAPPVQRQQREGQMVQGGGGGGQTMEPQEWDSFMMNNLSGTFAYIDDSLNENVSEKMGYSVLSNLNNFRIITPDDDGMKNKGELKPVAYSADVGVSQQQSSQRANPFADSRGQQQQSSTHYNPNAYGGGGGGVNHSFDPKMFQDQNYEGNDSRSNSRKSQFDSQMEAFKNARDMGMPQPLRRL